MALTLRPTIGMRNLEVSLQEFGEFLLNAKLVREKSAPHVVRWVRRFLSAPASQGALTDQAHPHVDAIVIRDYLTHLAIRQGVSASTQNQAFCALLFLCREVLGFEPDGLGATVRARRGAHLPVVLSLPEVAALLEAMRGIPRLMATLIYGGGLRVSECCELRVKDIDFDQGLVFVRSAKGDKDQSTRPSTRR